MLKFPGKIPVSIYPFFWVLVFLIGWLNSGNIQGTLIWAGIIVVSVLVHEFGHALTAVFFGQTAKIELVGLGGVTQRKGSEKLKLWQEFIIVLNGPLAGFTLAAISWWAYSILHEIHPDSLVTYASKIAFYVNFFWTILNLLPVQPLDGGKLFSIFLESIFGLKGVKIALFISLLLAAAFGIFFFAMREFFIGSVFMLFTFESYKSWKESLSITEADQNLPLLKLLKEAENEWRLGYKSEALKHFQEIRDMTSSGVIYRTVTEGTAHLLADRGSGKEAYEMLMSLGKQISADGLNLLHRLAYSQQQWKEVISLGDKVYQNNPNYQVALFNAASHSAIGNVKPAIGWIQCAIQDGLPEAKQISGFYNPHNSENT